MNAVKSHQTSRAACRDSCQDTSGCYFWSWVKSGLKNRGSTQVKGHCILKNARGRENVIPAQNYVSGSRQCTLPEDSGNDGFHLNN